MDSEWSGQYVHSYPSPIIATDWWSFTSLKTQGERPLTRSHGEVFWPNKPVTRLTLINTCKSHQERFKLRLVLTSQTGSLRLSSTGWRWRLTKCDQTMGRTVVPVSRFTSPHAPLTTNQKQVPLVPPGVSAAQGTLLLTLRLCNNNQSSNDLLHLNCKEIPIIHCIR